MTQSSYDNCSGCGKRLRRQAGSAAAIICHDCRRTLGTWTGKAAGDGRRSHPLYGIWLGIMQRCGNPKHVAYAQYGGRGISICEAWRTDFWGFVDYVERHLGQRPDKKTLDRINGDGHYEPGNIRWATRKEQIENRTIYGRSPADRRRLDEAVASLWAAGECSWPRIADHLNVTIWQVRRSLNRLGLQPR